MGGIVIKPDVFFRYITVTPACWIWKGFVRKGYGQYSGTHAHRVSFQFYCGPIPPGLELDHLCRNPLCVNPDHLEPVTRAENMRRRSVAQTHCKHGHEFTPENTYMMPSGGRQCRACNRNAVARLKARRMAS
jgi:hypothetical protein